MVRYTALLLVILFSLFVSPILAVGQSEKPAFNWRASSFSLPPGALFTRTSPGSRIGPKGNLEVMPPGAPRFDFDPVSHALRGLLFEERRVRLNKFAAAPKAAESVNIAATGYTLSFYGSGTVQLAGVVEATVTGIGAYPARTVFTFIPDTAGVLSMTPSGDVRHLQLEAGKFPTSAIVGSEGSQLAREADVLKLPTTAFRFNSTKGTLFVEYTRSVKSHDTAALCGVSLNDATTNNYISLCNDSGGNRDQGVVRINGSNVFQANIGYSSLYPVKKALSWASNNIKFAKDGTVFDVVETTTAMPIFKYLTIGSLLGENSLNGHVMAVQCYKNTLMKEDLRVITANIRRAILQPSLPAILMLLISGDSPAGQSTTSPLPLPDFPPFPSG